MGPNERQRCWKILEEVADLFCVRVIAAVVMSNHFHLIVVQPGELPDEAEVCRRYERYYGGRRKLTVGTPECRMWRQRLGDISWMMRILKARLTLALNRRTGRRGPFWADRFKSVILGSAEAIWSCWKYVEQNPVRAGLTNRASRYWDGTLGRWVREGVHPWAEGVEEVVLRWLGQYLGVARLEEVRARLLEIDVEAGCGQREVPGCVWVLARVVGPWSIVVRLTGRASAMRTGDRGLGLWMAHRPRAWKN